VHILFSQKVLYYLLRMKGIVFIPVVLIYVILCSYIAFSLEPDTYGSYFNAFWWVMTTLTTVGYGDFYPVTTEGKAFAVFLYITGIGLIGIFIGKVIDSFSYIKRMREEGKMKFTGKDHLIIVGWSKKAEAAIQEIQSSGLNYQIVILDEREKAPLLGERIFYVRGKATEEETLLQANLLEARGVLIFADREGDPAMSIDTLSADGKTLLVATAITAVEQKWNVSVHVTVEVMDQKHIQMFKHVKVDEFIASDHIISYLAVQTLFSHGITNLYTQLISRQHGSNLYQLKKRAHWITYKDAIYELLQEGATLIAAGNDLQINQKQEERIPEDAKLYVICDQDTYARIR
jgi:voltage-gated potassium channel